MIDPLLLVEMMEVNPDWEVHYLDDDKGIFIGTSDIFYKLVETIDELDEE